MTLLWLMTSPAGLTLVTKLPTRGTAPQFLVESTVPLPIESVLAKVPRRGTVPTERSQGVKPPTCEEATQPWDEVTVPLRGPRRPSGRRLHPPGPLHHP